MKLERPTRPCVASDATFGTWDDEAPRVSEVGQKWEVDKDQRSEATADDGLSDTESDSDGSLAALPFGAIGAFDGHWMGRGELRQQAFHFYDGPVVPVRFLGCDEIELSLEGEMHRGVLQDDGSLHWDDGDVWTRGASEAVRSRFGFSLHEHIRLLRGYTGAAIGASGIVVGFTHSFVEVRFEAGRIVRCSACDLQQLGPRSLDGQEGSKPVPSGESCDLEGGELKAEGMSFVSSLEGIWVGRGELRGETFTFADGPAVPVCYPEEGVIELILDGERHRGVLQKDSTLKWGDGDIWRREFEEAARSRFGLDLHVRVRLLCACSGIQAGQFGCVVGFTKELVEVKFGVRIARCLAEHLECLQNNEFERPSSHSDSGAMVADGTSCAPRTWSQVVRAPPRKELQAPQDRMPKPSSIRRQDLDTKTKPAARTSRTTARPQAASLATSQQIKRPDDSVVKSAKFVRTAPRTGGTGVSSAASSSHERPHRASVQIAPPARERQTCTPKPQQARPSPQTTPACASEVPADGQWYTGVVRWSSGSMAWLRCEALRERFPERDVFLHRSGMVGHMPRQWDRLLFRLTIVDGTPKAMLAKPHREEEEEKQEKMSYDDWCKSRKKTR